jgi:two-component system sensor histidine kinase UhpB
MTGRPLRILLLEDSAEDAELILAELRLGGYEPAAQRVETEAGFQAALAGAEWDIVIADHSLPQYNALAALQQVRHSGLDLPFIIVSGTIGEELAVLAMKSGAHDYILKSSLARLAPAVEREMRETQNHRERLRAEAENLRLAAIVESSGDAIVGEQLDGTILTWNSGAERLFGYRAAEVKGRPMKLLLPPDRLEEETRLLEQIQRGERIDHFETVRVRKDGRRLNVSVSVSPIRDGDGRIAGLSKIARDITEQKLAEHGLRNSREQLRSLAAHLQSVREEERKRIAREIHDELGQSLTGFKMDLAWLRNRLLGEDGTPARAPLVEKIAAMGAMLDGLAGLVRRLCTELRPGVLDDLGLVAAIEWQAREYQSRTGIRCELNLETGELSVDPERSTALFRILQEILTNAARHAKATVVKVSLRRAGHQLRLEVRDNGRGIKESEQAGTKSLGLLGLRERVYILGGEIEIEGKPGQGTWVRVRVPLPQPGPDPGAGRQEPLTRRAEDEQPTAHLKI